MINIPAAINSWPMWVEGQAYQDPAVMPAASARTSLWPSGDLAFAQFGDRVGEVTPLYGVPHRGSV